MDIWGKLTSIDLENCNIDTIKSKESIQLYIDKLCELIQMKKFGEAQIVHFGQTKKVEGFSFTQLIETSCITGHFANNLKAAFIDIFSCSEYNSEEAAEFTASFFEAKAMNFSILNRYIINSDYSARILCQ